MTSLLALHLLKKLANSRAGSASIGLGEHLSAAECMIKGKTGPDSVLKNAV